MLVNMEETGNLPMNFMLRQGAGHTNTDTGRYNYNPKCTVWM